MRLPWRENNVYPEIEESFIKLRETFEAELSAAHGSAPMQEKNCLETSAAAKAEIAPGVLAERFFHLARRCAQEHGNE